MTIWPKLFTSGGVAAIAAVPVTFVNGLGYTAASKLAIIDTAAGSPAAGSVVVNGFNLQSNGRMNVKVDQAVTGSIARSGFRFAQDGSLHVTTNAGAATFRNGIFLMDSSGRVLFTIG